MFLHKFLFFHHNDDSYWFGWIVIVLVTALYYVAFFLSKGFAFYYSKAKINSDLKKVLAFLQIGCSLVLALALPNNYLNEYAIINKYYTKNGLWIFASNIFLFLIFVLLFGIAFSLLARLYTRETEETEA